MADGLSDLFEQQTEFAHNELAGAASPEDIFSILETYEITTDKEIPPPFNPFEECDFVPRRNREEINTITKPSNGDETEENATRARKKLKISPKEATAVAFSEANTEDGQQKISHITVERNRRKQMNEHLSVLRSLMPSFYVKRGDQASIIGGVIDYIKELQQVLQSLEAKKQRKAYSEVLSPKPVPSPRPSPLSPRPPPPPLSPRMAVPISPRTPQPGSPYKPRMQQKFILSPTTLAPVARDQSPCTFDSSNLELAAANAKSPAAADVEVKFSGPNVLLKTVSHRIPGQALKIIAALESLALEILHVSISTIDETLLNSFTIKIGIECQLSAEELAQEIQRTFS